VTVPIPRGAKISSRAESQPHQVGFDAEGQDDAQEEEDEGPESELTPLHPAPWPMDGEDEMPEPAEGRGAKVRGVGVTTMRGHARKR